MLRSMASPELPLTLDAPRLRLTPDQAPDAPVGVHGRRAERSQHRSEVHAHEASHVRHPR